MAPPSHRLTRHGLARPAAAEQRARFLETLTGQGRSITIDAIRERFFQYWTNVDADLGAALRARF